MCVAWVLVGARNRSPSTDWAFVARVSGIPVSDTAGRVMRAPFLGGFDVPRPQLVDINGDGKLDLFVQERSGELMYFEREGDEWVWKSDRFQDIDIGEWYRFVDIDRDGDADLFAEQLTGYIRVWKNAGTATLPRLVAMGDTVRDVDGRAIVADRQNILNAVDIDCNGRLDLFIGRVQGVVDRYEQEGFSPDSSPRFRLVEEMWQGIEVLGPEVSGLPIMRSDTSSREPEVVTHYSQPTASREPRAASSELSTHDSQPTTHFPRPITHSLRPTTPFAVPPTTPFAVPTRRHGANTLTFADLHGRGIYDLFWGDFFEEGLLRFENAGSCAQPDMTAPPARFPPGKPVLTSGYNASTFGDIDGDKNVDMVIGVIGGAYGPSRTSIDNLYVVRQAPKDTWTVTTRRVIPTIDVGADAAPTLGDLNGDGLVDLLIGGKVLPNSSTTGSVTWFANVGTATQPAFRERGVLPIRGDFNYAPAIADLNGDSLPDIIVGTWRDRVHWYRNSGTRAQPAWTLADTALVTITRGTNSTPSIGDLDGDGLLDLIVGEASGTINVYKNTGTKTAPVFALVSDHFQDIKVSRRSAPLLFDMDNDGKLDMVLGAGDGHIQLWRGVGNTGEIRFERDESFALTSYANAMPAAADLHRNGRTELLVGTAAGGLRWFENRAAR